MSDQSTTGSAQSEPRRGRGLAIALAIFLALILGAAGTFGGLAAVGNPPKPPQPQITNHNYYPVLVIEKKKPAVKKPVKKVAAKKCHHNLFWH